MTMPSQPLARGFTSRRKLLQLSLCGIGTLALTTLPKAVTAQSSYGKTLTFNDDDDGILNFALLLEEVEAAFYAAVAKFSDFNPTERDYIRALGNHEAEHVKFLRSVLGDKAIFTTKDLSFSQIFRSKLTNRTDILNTAVALEDTGVHAYNGAGTKLTNPVYLLAAGAIVSVEARHAAGVRRLLGQPVTETAEDEAVKPADLVPELNPFNGRAYDELYTPKQIIAIAGPLINNPVTGTLVA